MNDTSIEYDFVPQTITVGRFGGANGFVTCRYEYDKWQNISIFERLCKYKPHDQRDPEKQLKKTIYNAVSVFDNEPVSGFAYVDHNNDLYCLTYHDDSDDIVLHDPRGFNVAVTVDNFWYMMNCCGDTMTDGVMDHKFAYAWHKYTGRFMIVDAETSAFKKCKEASDKFKIKIDTNTYLTKKQLEVGKVYLGTDKFPGKHMYLGEMDVYDADYHKDAMTNKRYADFDKYCKEKQYGNIFGKSRLVFYRIDDKDKHEKMTPYPFSFRSSISKMLEREVDLSKEGVKLLPMFNDKTKLATYENIREYMTTCQLFNKIDFRTYSEGSKKCPFDMFNSIIESILDNSLYHKIPFDIFPHTKYECHLCAFKVGNAERSAGYGYYIRGFYNSGRNYCDKYVNISLADAYAKTPEYKIYEAVSGNDYWRRQEFDRLKNISIQELYDYLCPLMCEAKFENGKAVRDIDMLILQGNNAPSK